MDRFDKNHRDAGVSATKWARIIPREPVAQSELAKLGEWLIRQSNGCADGPYCCPDGQEWDGRLGPVLRAECHEPEPVRADEQVRLAMSFVIWLSELAIEPHWAEWEQHLGRRTTGNERWGTSASPPTCTCDGPTHPMPFFAEIPED
jgi:hypothetical protein